MISLFTLGRDFTNVSETGLEVTYIKKTLQWEESKLTNTKQWAWVPLLDKT